MKHVADLTIPELAEAAGFVYPPKDELVARDECTHCNGTGEEFIGVDPTGQEAFVPYCDYCGEFWECLDCGEITEEGERIVATLDAIQGAETGFDLVCPNCHGDNGKITNESPLEKAACKAEFEEER